MKKRLLVLSSVLLLIVLITGVATAAEVVIVGSKAWRDNMEELGLQGPGDEEQNYKNAPKDADQNGVNMVDGARGFAEGTAVSHWNWRGHWLKWNLNVPKAGDYALVICYATDEKSDSCLRTLKVNDKVIRGDDNPIRMTSTGGFASGGNVSQWGYQVADGITIEAAGEVSVVLTNAGTAGIRQGTNLAWIALVSPADTPLDDNFIRKIEEAIGVERTGSWK